MTTRQTLLDSDGYARSVHPVDQEVALSLGVELGTLSSSPDTGVDINRLRRASSDVLQNVAKDVVNVALSGPLSRRDIQILTVQVTRDARM
jgi:hypothetical protein